MTGAFDNIHPGLTCESAYRILRSDANDLTCQSDFYMATSHLINFPGPETESSLLEFLKRPASEKSIAHAQRKAVEVIARLGIRKAQAQIGDCLDSDDVYLVENAAWALGQLDCQDHHLHDKMIRLLDDAPPNSRVLIQALAKLEVRWYDHANPADAARVFAQLESEDGATSARLTRPVRRRWLITEACFGSTGRCAPLRELVALKDHHHARMILDESLSFGAMGETGRGLTEHVGLSSSAIDVICASLENACASVGGFVAGDTGVVAYQRPVAVTIFERFGVGKR